MEHSTGLLLALPARRLFSYRLRQITQSQGKMMKGELQTDAVKV
jgi:hypothetical protein